MTSSSFLSLGVVYTILLLVVSSLSVIPVTGQDNNDPPPSCSDHCPCSGGIPGMPGMPGLHGPQGPAGNPGNEGATGAKGARGSRGDEGEQGVAGPPGPAGNPGNEGATGEKGERGDHGNPVMDGTDGATGLKGDQGVAGPPGVNGDKGTKGDTGSPGSQGSKGEPGGPYIPPPLSAFQVQRTSHLHVNSGYQTIDFDSIKLDLGNDISPTSGFFTCRIPGLYNFAFNGISASSSSSYKVDIYLMHNSNLVAWAYANPGNDYARSSVSFSTILALDRDDEVYLRAYSSTHLQGGTAGENSFSGYLIYEIPEAK